MSENNFYEKRKGVWVKVVKDLQGNEHEVGISDAEQAELESSSEHKKVRSVSNTELKALMKEAIAETGIQERKDEASFKDAKTGGGVVRLDSHNVNPTSGNPYQSVHDELDRLHMEEARGSNKAKKELDGLFNLLGREIMSEAGCGLVLVSCPSCSKPIETSSTSTCPFCGFSLIDSGYTQHGEIHGGKRF